MLFAQVFIEILTILILNLNFIKGAIYEFIIENDDIFESCPDMPNTKGIDDLADISDFVIDYRDGKIYCHGNVSLVWDVSTTDRVQLRGEIMKYQRGAWQLTPISMVVWDLCKVLYNTDTIWYRGWSHAVHEMDRLCLNNKGHTLHHDPFFINTELEMITYVEGRVKLVVHVEAFDQNDVKNPSTVCLEIRGEMIKHRDRNAKNLV